MGLGQPQVPHGVAEPGRVPTALPVSSGEHQPCLQEALQCLHPSDQAAPREAGRGVSPQCRGAFPPVSCSVLPSGLALASRERRGSCRGSARQGGSPGPRSSHLPLPDPAAALTSVNTVLLPRPSPRLRTGRQLKAVQTEEASHRGRSHAKQGGSLVPTWATRSSCSGKGQH